MYLQIYTTTKTKNEAEKIAKVLCNKKLSACTQIIGPIGSIYKWKGKIKKSKEWLCIIKTKREKYKKIEKVIKQIHSYEIPEIIAVPIIAGSQDCFKWLDKEI